MSSKDFTDEDFARGCEHFVRGWETARSPREVAAKFGISVEDTFLVFAWMKNEGVRLKSMPQVPFARRRPRPPLEVVYVNQKPDGLDEQGVALLYELVTSYLEKQPEAMEGMADGGS